MSSASCRGNGSNIDFDAAPDLPDGMDGFRFFDAGIAGFHRIEVRIVARLGFEVQWNGYAKKR